METIKIDRVTVKDLVALQAISRKTFYETFVDVNTEADMMAYLNDSFAETQLLSELENPNSLFYFARLNGEVIAYLKLNIGDAQKENPTENALEIERIYVLQDYQGKRIGQLLYTKALAVAKDLQVEYVWLGVWENNLKAMKFYEKNGFLAFSSHVFKVGSDEQTDILMKKELNVVHKESAI